VVLEAIFPRRPVPFKVALIIADRRISSMLTVDIPGREILKLEYLVLDYNGTLALDGYLLPGVAGLLDKIAHYLEIFVVTADTFGLAARGLAGLPVKLDILSSHGQAAAKLGFVKSIGAEKTCAIGNGHNDRLMLSEAALGVVIIGPEGASQATVDSSDLVCPDVNAALSLLLNPLRLVASLRD
jgi:soluble P-type ATPase